MNITKTELTAIGIVVLAAAVTGYFYSQAPERVACHWDLQGRVNGYMPKAAGLWMTPGIMAVMAIFLLAVPRLASAATNIGSFRRFYGAFTILFNLFLLSIQYQVILWNVGIRVNPGYVLLVMVPVLIIGGLVWWEVSARGARRG